VQEYLWLRLPRELPGRAGHDLAWALGDLFAAAGLHDLAALCREPRTHELIAAWEEDPSEAERAARAAEAASGVRPPDTPLLTFSDVRAASEAEVFRQIGRLLERGSAEDAAALTERHLTTPGDDGRTPLERIRRQRLDRWSEGWQGALGEVTTPEDRLSAAKTELSVAPVRALLEEIGAGVRLGPGGRLPGPLAARLDARFGWSVVLPSGSEPDLVQLEVLHRHLLSQRLLRRSGDHVEVTPWGLGCRTSTRALWTAVVAVEPRWSDAFDRDVLAVCVQLLLRTRGAHHEAVTEEVSRVVGARWEPTSGVPLVAGVARTVHDWWRVGIPLGWWEEPRFARRSTMTLSEFGRAAATDLFWSATA
jgi:hypothetical protein